MLGSYGVHILNEIYVTVGANAQQVNLCGIAYPDAMSFTNSGVETITQLELLSQAQQNGNYTILLAHRPELIETYIDYNFDLVLSGHGHGGQWRFPGIINGLYAPNQGWFPKYAGGRYEIEETTMIVSRGLAKKVQEYLGFLIVPN